MRDYLPDELDDKIRPTDTTGNWEVYENSGPVVYSGGTAKQCRQIAKQLTNNTGMQELPDGSQIDTTGKTYSARESSGLKKL